MKFRIRFFSFILFSLSFQLWSNSVFAYLPPSQFILKNWVTKHSGAHTLRIRTNVTKYQNEKATEFHFKETSVINLENQTIKSWASDDQDHKLFIMERSLSSVPLGTRILFSASLHDMTQALKKNGIPVRSKEELLELKTEAEKTNSENVFLSRWNNSIAWVVGVSEPKRENFPQVWFEKDTFLLLRLLYQGENHQDFLDFRYDSFKFAREFPFPRTLTVAMRGSGPVLVSQLSEFLVNADNSRLLHSSAGETGFTAAGEAASSGVKELIRFYYADVR